MTKAIYYPPADRSQWYGSGNATVAPTKVLWHTTETPGGWPAYAGGSMAPNLTYDPWKHEWRQHFPLNGTARALANGSGYSTNRMGVCQVEVSCYCDPARFSTGRGINKLDQHAYDDMSAFAQFMHDEWGVPFDSLPTKPYPSSYGNNGVRLSGPAFRDYQGHCGHMHAPYNTHGDGGLMSIDHKGTVAPSESVTSVNEAIDMFVGQDQSNGNVYLVSGNTKLRFPNGGNADGTDLYVSVLLDMIRQAYPDGPAPKLVALNPTVANALPDVSSLVEPTE